MAVDCKNKRQMGHWSLCATLALFSPSIVNASGLCATTAWDPRYRKEEIPSLCAEAQSCADTRHALLEANERYQKLAQAACQKGRETKESADSLSQEKSFDRLAAAAREGKTSVNEVLAENRRLQAEVVRRARPNVQAAVKSAGKSATLASPEIRIEKLFQRASQNPKTLKGGISFSDLQAAHSRPSRAQVQTLERSANFVSFLIQDEELQMKAARELEAIERKAQRLGEQQGETDDGGSGKGFDMASMLPLAGPLAGLLQNTPDTDANHSSASLSGLESSAGADPESTGNSSSPAATPFTAQKNGEMTNAPQDGTEESSPLAGDMPFASGLSAVNEGTNSLPARRGFAGTSLSGGGTVTAANAGGNGAGESGEKSEAAERKLAAKEENAEELLPFGGGGGGGLHFPSNPAGSEESTDSMGEVLHEMTAMAEQGSFADSQEDGGIEAADTESLFPRVTACYQRSLKRGLVLHAVPVPIE